MLRLKRGKMRRLANCYRDDAAWKWRPRESRVKLRRGYDKRSKGSQTCIHGARSLDVDIDAEQQKLEIPFVAKLLLDSYRTCVHYYIIDIHYHFGLRLFCFGRDLELLLYSMSTIYRASSARRKVRRSYKLFTCLISLRSVWYIPPAFVPVSPSELALDRAHYIYRLRHRPCGARSGTRSGVPVKRNLTFELKRDTKCVVELVCCL
jgi:hypothetical protein